MQKILRKIKRYQYISFDLFDTLIRRSVPSPIDVFRMVETKYNDENDTIYNFAKKRIIAEQKARTKTSREDVTLEEIYDYIHFDQSIKIKLIELEKNIEIYNCYLQEDVAEIYNKCIEAGKKVIITTDMYLPVKCIEQILERLKISNYTKLYVSSEIGLTKRSGHIWKYILQDLQISSIELLHIGDSVDIDIIPAKKNGISTEVIEYQEIKWGYWEKVSKRIEIKQMLTCANGLSKKEKSPHYLLGSRLMGPFLFQFCTWLHEENLKHNFNKIVFMAREGYLLYLLYKEMYPEDYYKLCYLKINRNTLRLPLLSKDNSIEQFLSYIKDNKEYQIRQICEMFLIDVEGSQCINLLNSCNYTLDTIISVQEMRLNEKFILFYHGCLEIAKDKIAQQDMLLCKYLEQNGIEGKVALVNNSMHGSAQTYLQKMYPQINFWGLYFVLTHEGQKSIRNNCSIWLKNESSQIEKRIFCRNSLVFEHLMFEDSGTAKYYDATDGKVRVVCESHKPEQENDFAINEVRRGATDFVELFCRMPPMKVRKRDCIKTLVQLLVTPKLEDAIAIGELIDSDYEGTRKLAAKERVLDTKLHTLFKTKCVPWKNAYLVMANKPLVLKLYNIYIGYIETGEKFV